MFVAKKPNEVVCDTRGTYYTHQFGSGLGYFLFFTYTIAILFDSFGLVENNDCCKTQKTVRIRDIHYTADNIEKCQIESCVRTGIVGEYSVMCLRYKLGRWEIDGFICRLKNVCSYVYSNIFIRVFSIKLRIGKLNFKYKLFKWNFIP